jgi:hypothetical protein
VARALIALSLAAGSLYWAYAWDWHLVPLIVACVFGAVVLLRAMGWLLKCLWLLPTIPVKFILLAVRRPIWVAVAAVAGVAAWLLVANLPTPVFWPRTEIEEVRSWASHDERLDIPLSELRHLDLLHSDWRAIRQSDGTARARWQGGRLMIPLPDIVATPPGQGGLFQRPKRLVIPDRRIVKEESGVWKLEEGDWTEYSPTKTADDAEA